MVLVRRSRQMALRWREVAPEAGEARFQSVLFEQPARGAGVDGLQEPDFFATHNHLVAKCEASFTS